VAFWRKPTIGQTHHQKAIFPVAVEEGCCSLGSLVKMASLCVAKRSCGRKWRPTEAGLPDGIFSYQKFSFGYFWEGLGMEIVGIF
jgi:hypothetical protein